MIKNAFFIFDGKQYFPANKNAVGICAILSKMRLLPIDMASVRSHGYVPRLLTGEEIGNVRIDV